MSLHPNYVCKCQVPKEMVYLGERTGLCMYCRGVYDEGLYEMRLRQHVKNFTYESVHDYLLDIDPNYQALHQ